MSTERRDLRGDTRGAILIAAVFMAVFLVGCLWYLVGIGDAAIYREKMQDGSDAVAFASAVYHARGMNIIAVLNLIMAAALAVLIAFKIAEIVAFTIAAIAAAICPFSGWACPIATAAGEIGEDLHSSVIPAVQKAVDAILTASSESQRWIARITPWVGAARGVSVASQYGPSVKEGAALSISMVPSTDRLGLPVQEEPFDKLCARAGKMLGNLAFGWIPGMSLAGSLIGKLTGAFPGYFCGSSSSSSSGGAVPQGDMDQIIKDQCADAKKAYDQANKGKKGVKPFDTKKCEDDAKKKMATQPTSTGGGLSSTGSKTSKMIYASAHNGDDYFQVYGFVVGDNEAMHQNAKKRVEMAGWGKATLQNDSTTDTLEKIGFAEAEFYYDQVQSGKLGWSDYKDDALWNMRWRARLRRFRLPTQMGLGAISGAMGSVTGIPSGVSAGGGFLGSAAGAIDGAVDFFVIH
jgi:hypothetical protein